MIMGIQYIPEEQPSDRAMRELREQQERSTPSPDELTELARHANTLIPSISDANTSPAMTGILPSICGSSPGVRRFSSSSPVPGVEGLLAGIRPQHSGQGRESWEAVLPTDVMKVGNVEMTIAIAERAGLVMKTRDGYRPAAAPTPEQLGQDAEAKAAADAANAPINALTPELKTVISNLPGMVGSEARAESIVTSVVAKGIDGNWKAAGAALARGTGIHPEQAEGNVSAAVADAVKSTAAVLTARFGIDGAATLQHISETMPALERANPPCQHA
jgi:hypothetical protein